jgi:membrane protease YdiL (CAAX protease family)
MKLRLRHWMNFSLVRLAVYLVLTIISLLIPFQVFGLYLQVSYPGPWMAGLLLLKLSPYLKLVAAIISVLVYCAMVARFEKRPVSELGGPKPVQALMAGFLLGMGLMAAACGIQALLGNLALGPSPRWSLNIIDAAGTALAEEILFRAILFRILQQGFGTSIALGVSALLFGLAHAVNADASISRVIAIAIEGGLPLTMAYTVTQRLWLPIGIHLGWDLAFGQLIAEHGTGLLVLSGGALIEAPPGLALALYLGWKTKRQGLWRPVRLQLAFRSPGNAL